MRIYYRINAIIIALIMAVSVFHTSAFAEGTYDETAVISEDTSEQVQPAETAAVSDAALEVSGIPEETSPSQEQNNAQEVGPSQEAPLPVSAENGQPAENAVVSSEPAQETTVTNEPAAEVTPAAEAPAENNNEADGRQTLEYVLNENDPEKEDIRVMVKDAPACASLMVKEAQAETYDEQIAAALGKKYEVLFALNISIGENIKTENALDVVITAESLNALDENAVLYHINKENKAEKTEYKSDKENNSIEFSAGGFSPFVLVKAKEESDAEKTTAALRSTKAAADENAAADPAGEDAEGEPETEDTDVSEGEQSDSGGAVSGSGMTIDNISIKWLSKSTGTDTPAGKDTLHLVSDSVYTGDQQFQIDFSLSGKDDHPAGTVEIIIPAYIWLDRNGNEPGTFDISVPEAPETGSDFNWRRVGDNIVITNTRKIGASTKVMIQASFENVPAQDMVDKDMAEGSDAHVPESNTGISDPLYAVINVTTRSDEVISMTSNSIYADIDTKVEAASATKSASDSTTREYFVYHTKEKAIAAGIPQSFLDLLGDDADNYSFMKWYVSGSATGSQPCLVTVTDTYNGEVLHYLDATHTESETVQVRGRMLGVSGAFVNGAEYTQSNVVSEDGESVTAVLFDGYSTAPKSAYVWTAYLKEDFPDKESEYYISNHQTITVTGSDDLKVTTKEADASAPFRVPVIYTIKKVWDDNNDAAGHRPESLQVYNYYKPAAGNSYSYSYGTVNEDNDWSFSWSDDGTARKYYAGENLPQSVKYNLRYDEDGELCAYDEWWYSRKATEYDSDTHTWIFTNEYHEQHVELAIVPFIVPQASANMDKYLPGQYTSSPSAHCYSNLESTKDRDLNILRRGSDVIVDYIVTGSARTMAYTLGEGYTPNVFTSYGRRDVKLELEDNYGADALGTALNNTLLFDDSIRLTLDDAEIAYVTLYNPSFQQYYQNTKYSSWNFYGFSPADPPVEELWGLLVPDGADSAEDGTWVKYAEIVSGNVTVMNGAWKSGSKQVNLPARVLKVKTELVIPGYEGSSEDEWKEKRIDAAGMTYNVGVRLRGDSETIQERLEAVFALNDYGMCRLDNFGVLNVYDYQDTLKKSISDWSRAYLHGRNYRVAARSEKSFTMGKNDKTKKLITIHSKIKMIQQSNVLDCGEYLTAIEEGVIPDTTGGTWYDLLPLGVQPDISTVKLQSGDSLKDVYTIENYKNSGRVMLVVEFEAGKHYEYFDPRNSQYVNPYPNDVTYPKEGYFNQQILEFDATYSWDQIKMYGLDTARNVAAYEGIEDKLGNIDGWSGEPDDPQANFNQRAMNAVGDDKILMTDLDPDRAENNAFVYAGDVLHHGVINFMARTEALKFVTRDGLGVWSTGRDGTPQVTVNEATYYTYMLYVASGLNTDTANMILVDSLENYQLKEDDDDTDEKRWHGEFVSVDTSELEKYGVAPVIYYNTASDLDVTSEAMGFDQDNPTSDANADAIYNAITAPGSGWVKASDYDGDPADVKAVAIDCRYKTDGTPFVLKGEREADETQAAEEGESFFVTIRMKAKSYDTAGEEGDPFNADPELRKDAVNNGYAFNGLYLGCTQIDPLGRESPAYLFNDYVRVGIEPYEFTVQKKWNDDSNRDGVRPSSVVIHLIGNGEDTGRTVTLSEENGWKDVFKHVLQYDTNGNRISYTFTETSGDADYPLSDSEGNTIYLQSFSRRNSDIIITNTHHSEKTQVSFSKIWDNSSNPDEEVNNRPEQITVRLMADGVYTGKEVTVKPDRNGEWHGSFTNLPKYENSTGVSGEEHKIVYTTEEVPVYKYITTYGNDEETGDITITNTFYPFGDVEITKTVENATEVSSDRTFGFDIILKDAEGEDLTSKFNYVKYDAEGNVLDEGTIGNGGHINLKATERFVIKDIPSECTYEVTEDRATGFELVSSGGTSGAVRAGAVRTASFTNRYSASGRQSVSLTKTLEGRVMTNYQFRFELVDMTEGSDTYEQVISTASATAAGEAVFADLKYTEADHGKTFTYLIREVDREKPGYTYDESTYTMNVYVEDNGYGSMICTPSYTDVSGEPVEAADIAFNNVYTAEGDITLRAWKQLPGGTMTDGQFSFELLDMTEGSDVYGQVIQEKTNNENGLVTWDTISYATEDIGKTFFYVAREVKGSEGTVTYDESVKGYSISVADNGDGTLAVTQTNVNVVVTEDPETGKITYSKGEETTDLPVFVNTLNPGGLKITKQVSGEMPDETQEFSFVLTLFAQDELPGTISVKKPGDEEFTEAELGEDGTYSFALKKDESLVVKDLASGTGYQVRENTPAGWTLKMENAVGEIGPAESEDDYTNAVFTNTYEPGKATAAVIGNKLMDGKAASAGKFAFELIDDTEGSETNGSVLQTAVNKAGGFIQFDLEFEKEGTYKYKVKEVRKPVESVGEDGTVTYSEDEDLLRTISFDETEYEITVTVEKEVTEGFETLIASVEMGPERIEFKNTTNPGSLQIKKTGIGVTEANKDAEFTFKVRLSNDAGMPLTESGNMFWFAEEDPDAADPEETPVYTPDPADNASPEVQTEPAFMAPVLMSAPRLLGADSTGSSGMSLMAAGTSVKSNIAPSSDQLYRSDSYGNVSDTVKWTLYADGTLIIEPIDGEYGKIEGTDNVTEANNKKATIWPWLKYSSNGYARSDYIKRVQIKGHIDVTRGTVHMFGYAYNMVYADLSGLYTTDTTKSAYGMLADCHYLEYIDIRNFAVKGLMANSEGANLFLDFRGEGALKVIVFGPDWDYKCNLGGRNWKNLDTGKVVSSLSEWYGEKLAGTWVKQGYDPNYTIVFDANGGTGTMDSITCSLSEQVMLPDCEFENDLQFAGWSSDPNAAVPEYASGDTFKGVTIGGQTITLYAIWMSEDSFLLNYDAGTNGGYSRVQWQRVNGPDDTVTLPTPTHPSNYEFLGWNTAADGTGTSYSGTVKGSIFNAQPGDRIKLYAQFLDPSKYAKLTVRYYQQNADRTDYDGPVAMNITVHPLNSTVTPEAPQYEYTGFITPEQAADVTMVKGGVFVDYKYDRTSYTLSFDANGGEGTMSDVTMTGAVAAKLPVNRFTKEDSMFIGWNTAADGSGTNYGDGQKVNTIAGNGETLVLYAQWYSLDDAEEAEATNGEYTVTCKAGEIIQFPNLPAGTHYEIVEVDLPEGWTLESMENGTGTVLSAERINVTAVNKYSAEGSADLIAHKTLVGETITSGQFSFELLDEDGNVLETVSNSSVDETEEIAGEGDETVPNPWLGTAPVRFSVIDYDAQGIYKYKIREKAGSDTIVNYDIHEENVTVLVTDKGNGRLNTQVFYDDDQAAFLNTMTGGDLEVSKTLVNATPAAANAEFTFTLRLYDSTGNELHESYPVTLPDGSEDVITSGDSVVIKGGQSFRVTGLPHKSTYTIEEAPAAGFEKIQEEGISGTIFAGETVNASITNAYTVSTTEGGVNLAVSKIFDGGTIEKDQFEFRLISGSGEELERVFAAEDGSINFSTIFYGAEDAGNRYVYYIEEVVPEEKDDHIIYDTHRERVDVDVVDNGDGTMGATVYYQNGDSCKFTNIRLYDLTVSKQVEDEQDADKRFEFTIELTKEGEPFTGFEAPADAADWEEAGDGEYTFTLSSSETLTITIPTGVSYVIKENADGYDAYVVITDNAGEELENSSDESKTAGGTITRDTGSQNVDFTNCRIAVLPSTGGPGTGMFMFAGILLLIAAAAMFMILKKRRI